MAKYAIITPAPRDGSAPYSLTGSMYIGGPPPVGQYTANSDDSLQGWWRCNEAPSSVLADSSNKARPASNNLPVFSSVAYPSELIQLGSCTWDGLTTGPNIGTAAMWDAIIGSDISGGSTQQMSFSIWIKQTGPGDSNYSRLYQFGDDGNITGQVWTYLKNNDKLHFSADFDGDRGEWVTTSVPADWTKWNHVLVTYDATSDSNNPVIYVNGVSVPIEFYSGRVPSGTYTGIKDDPCIIGNRSGLDRTFEGYIADFAVWNKVLTSNDAAILYAAQAGPIYYTYRDFGLIGYGQRLSPTGSQERLSLQGLDAQPDDIYFPSLLPRLRQGAPMSLWRQGEKISDKYFDDTLAMNPNPQDMRGVGDIKVTQRMNFGWEQLNFGQAPTVQQGESYVETARFNPIDYLESSEETMWPVNLFNLGSLLDHEFDGVIEPFDIRSELLGIVRSRFEGHSVRGGLTGGASETYFGSKQIVDTWHDNDAKAPFFLDAPINWETIPVGAYSNITQEPDAPFYDQTAFGITTSPLVMNNPAHLQPAKISYSVFTSFPGEKWTEGPAGYRNLPSSGNLLAWWRLNTDVSATGDAVDSSGNDHEGIFPSTNRRPDPSSASPAPYVQTITANFDGSLNQVRLENGSVWNPLIGGSGASSLPFSIVFWINPDISGVDSNQGIVWFGSSFNEAHRGVIYNKGTGTVRFDVGSTTTNLATISAGVWTHVAVTYAGGSAAPARARIYIDGVQQSFLDINNGDVDDILAGSVCRLGSTHAGQYFKGLLADISVWGKRLLLAEIEALRDASNGVYELAMLEDPLLAGLRNISEDKNPRNPDVVDPTEKRANHGFYFGQNAGSIVYGDE